LDIAEDKVIAIKKVLGSYIYKIPVSFSKFIIGYLIGSVYALEDIIYILSINYYNNQLNVNSDNQNDICDLNFVPYKDSLLKIEVAISNFLVFIGSNIFLTFKK
jgi:3-oxoacyl-[acyl-carrier-protein] synthase II